VTYLYIGGGLLAYGLALTGITVTVLRFTAPVGREDT
jgi:hypothetical protein